MKNIVYVVFHYGYSDEERFIAIFSTREKAEKYILGTDRPSSYEIDEKEVR